MDNPERRATLGTQDTRQPTKSKTQHKICWWTLSSKM